MMLSILFTWVVGARYGESECTSNIFKEFAGGMQVRVQYLNILSTYLYNSFVVNIMRLFINLNLHFDLEMYGYVRICCLVLAFHSETKS